MKEKKQLILIAVAALVVIVLIVVLVFVRKRTGEQADIQDSDRADRMGIDYGGSFNEFQYIEENTLDASEETELPNEDEMKALDEKIRKEFEKKTNGAENIEKLEKIEPDHVTEDGKAADVQEKADASKEEPEEVLTGEEPEIVVQGQYAEGYAEYEVVCDAETQTEADAIAAQIGGKVKECHDGIAVITINENVDDLLARLEQQGSSLELHRNYSISIP